MIIDTAMKHASNSVLMHGDLRKAIRAELYGLKRFVFARSAAAKLRELAVDWDHIVYANSHMALPPFPVTYIEFPNVIAVDRDISGIETVGYLFMNGCFFVCCGNEKDAAFSPYAFWHYTVQPLFFTTMNFVQDNENYRKLSRYISAGLRPEASGEFVNLVRPMTDQWNLGIITPGLPTEEQSTAFSRIASEFAGCLRWGLAALLLLNERKRTRIEGVAASRKLVAGKVYPVAQHNIVKIDLDADQQYYSHTFSSQSRATARLHDVAAHWVHYDCSSQCQHRWVPYHSEEAEKRDMEVHGFLLPRYVCSLCGGRRTRKAEFERGDESKGKVQKHYDVIASKHDAGLDDEHGSMVKSNVLWQPGNNNEEGD